MYLVKWMCSTFRAIYRLAIICRVEVPYRGEAIILCTSMRGKQVLHYQRRQNYVHLTSSLHQKIDQACLILETRLYMILVQQNIPQMPARRVFFETLGKFTIHTFILYIKRPFTICNIVGRCHS